MASSLLNFTKEDHFFFTGLDEGRWFGRNFDDFVLFGYIGDRDRLEKAIREKSTLRKVFEVILPKLKISSLLRVVTGYDLGKVASDSGLAKQLFDLLAQEENRRTLSEQLSSIYSRGKKLGRYFDRVSKSELSKTPIFGAQPNKVEDHLVSVEGHLGRGETTE